MFLIHVQYLIDRKKITHTAVNINLPKVANEINKKKIKKLYQIM